MLIRIFSVFQGLPNGTENNQNVANIPNGPVSPQKRPSNGSASTGDLGGPQPPDSSPPKQIAISQNGEKLSHNSNEVDSKTLLNHSSQTPKVSNPLFGVNAAQQYLPNSNTNHISQAYNNGYSNGNKKTAEIQFESRQKELNGVRKAPEGQDNESYIHEDEVDNSKELTVGNPGHMDIPAEASATHYTTDNNGKINVHVTVMIG